VPAHVRTRRDFLSLAGKSLGLAALSSATIGSLLRNVEAASKNVAHLTPAIRENVTIDWTEREAVRARLRMMVKRILRKYGYPPDKQEAATRTVLEQAEVLCAEWAE